MNEINANWEVIAFWMHGDFGFRREYIIARFSHPDSAFEFIEKAKLKQPLSHRTFKIGSGLSPYKYASVRHREYSDNVPINPEL